MKLLNGNIPFHSQHWDLSDFQKLGFSSYDEAEYWQRSCCGILCLKMALETLNPASIHSLSGLIQKGLDIKAYTEKFGWDHKGLMRLGEEYSLKSKHYEKISPKSLKNYIQQNSIPIISIKWAFENKKNWKKYLMPWKKYGGHLALITGYEIENKELTGFYVHHTSIKPEYNWPHTFIPINTFKAGFTGRAIIVSK